jgi:hypothetical protein
VTQQGAIGLTQEIRKSMQISGGTTLGNRIEALGGLSNPIMTSFVSLSVPEIQSPVMKLVTVM